MTIVEQIFDVTTRLHTLIQDEAKYQDNRDEVIEKIEQLLQERQELLPQLKGPFSDEEQLLGKKIIEFNIVIDEKLPAILAEIPERHKQAKKTKVIE